MVTHLASATHIQTCSRMRMSLKTHSNFLQKPVPWSTQYIKECSCNLSVKPYRKILNDRSMVSCAINMTAGQSDDSGKLSFDKLMDKARKLWESSPQPVKSFPWNRALENFIQLTLDLILAVVKYLCVPLFAITSLSEMSYCAHEKKLSIVPFPLVIGFTVAAVLTETALGISPLLKDAEAPWHLITIAIFFTLLKIPGPYYPYWGRIFIPHFANGGLLRILWLSYFWFRRPQKTLKIAVPQKSTDETHSEK